MVEKDNFFVLTGGPGSGKTSVVNALARRGLHCIPEAGREIIQEQTLIGGRAVPWIDPRNFRELMLSRDLQAYRSNMERSEVVIFDRGIVDALGYSRLTGLEDDEHLYQAIKRYRYNRRVFIAPPWEEIYLNDSERKQTFREAIATYDAMTLTYKSAGYSLIELPLVSVERRARLILDIVSTDAG
jgi:predicted ATPase